MRVKRAYSCDSPFQVFTCVHLELHEHTNADIYILDAFKNAADLVLRLRECNMFRKVILVEAEGLYTKNKTVHKNPIKSSIKTFRTYWHVENIVESFIERDTVYDQFFFTCNQLSFRLARFYFIKKRYMTQFVMYDEGSGSYDGHFERVKLTDYLTRRFMFGKRSGNDNLDLYLYQPSLYFDYKKNENRIHKICPIDELDRDYQKEYSYLFQSKIPKIPVSCIFFDTVREEVFDTGYAFNSMQNWYQLIEDKIGADRMQIKTHPRAYGKYPHSSQEYLGSNCPIEIDYLSLPLDHMCLVALLSTAVISPKIIYDREPIVLLLCNVDKTVYEPDDNLLYLYRSVKALYREPDRFMIPESLDELKACLDKVSFYMNEFTEKRS